MSWIILLVIVVVIAMVVGAAKEKEKQRAKDAYENSHASLKSEPANSDRRQRTLALGRVYSNLLRDKKGNTLFDEVVMMYDINTACAATRQVISPIFPCGGVARWSAQEFDSVKGHGANHCGRQWGACARAIRNARSLIGASFVRHAARGARSSRASGKMNG